MTVKELIERLQAFDGGLPVAVVEYPYADDPLRVTDVRRLHIAGDGGFVGSEYVVCISAAAEGGD